jgi:2,4-dienoyl-CoA reductase-like NADH-dependent reductase (Old Yellow Enzyme family)
MLEKAGIDAIEVSGGNGSSRIVGENNLTPSRTKVAISKEKELYFKGHGAKLMKAVSIPVILTERNRSLDIMDGLLNNEEISYFGMARPVICEPDLIKKWETGNFTAPK